MFLSKQRSGVSALSYHYLLRNQWLSTKRTFPVTSSIPPDKFQGLIDQIEKCVDVGKESLTHETTQNAESSLANKLKQREDETENCVGFGRGGIFTKETAQNVEADVAKRLKRREVDTEIAYKALDELRQSLANNDILLKEKTMATIRLMEKLDGGQTSRDFGNLGDIVSMGTTLLVKETVESAGRATKQYILNKSSQNLEFRNKIIMIADKLYKWMCKLTNSPEKDITDLDEAAVIVTIAALAPIALVIVHIDPVSLCSSMYESVSNMLSSLPGENACKLYDQDWWWFFLECLYDF
ncbi:unnamed protein product [Arabidopsis arenosa]|uniref:Uncharacterized protein n=1 Tax=Arabidopsis arenosa TaxID=38785 RepID=A0A8S1ZP92_ARAAE|nr:unnamed protein product [Arabidopsis arenosa]